MLIPSQPSQIVFPNLEIHIILFSCLKELIFRLASRQGRFGPYEEGEALRLTLFEPFLFSPFQGHVSADSRNRLISPEYLARELRGTRVSFPCDSQRRATRPLPLHFLPFLHFFSIARADFYAY